MHVQRASHMWKRLHLESFYILLWKWYFGIDDSEITCDQIMDREAKSKDE